MKKLPVVWFGDEVQGVSIRGDSRQPEPETFRVSLPGADVDVVRCTDGTYWVHVAVHHPEKLDFPEKTAGRIIDGRVDVLDRHASETTCGDLCNPLAYHVAVRVAPVK